MQKTMKNTPTRDFTLALSKEIGKLWILKDIAPFHKSFKRFFEDDLKHDIGKLMTCGCTNYILDRLAGQDKEMSLKIRISPKKLKLSGFIEFELTGAYRLSARYLVNKCPKTPQLEAWVSDCVKQIFSEYPAFAYIQRV